VVTGNRPIGELHIVVGRSPDACLGRIDPEDLPSVDTLDYAKAAQGSIRIAVGEPKAQVRQPDDVTHTEGSTIAGLKPSPVQGRWFVLRHHLHYMAGASTLDANMVDCNAVVADSQRVRRPAANRHHTDLERVFPVPLRVKLPYERCVARQGAH
jgi:hypothetical protein